MTSVRGLVVSHTAIASFNYSLCYPPLYHFPLFAVNYIANLTAAADITVAVAHHKDLLDLNKEYLNSHMVGKILYFDTGLFLVHFDL
jgi:hypothetical protein